MIASLETVWTLDPLTLALAAGALYAQGFVRLRRRSGREDATATRAVLFLAGLAVSLLALVSPLGAVGRRPVAVRAHAAAFAARRSRAAARGAGRGPWVCFLPPLLLRLFARGRVRGLVSWLLRLRVSLGLWLASLGGLLQDRAGKATGH